MKKKPTRRKPESTQMQAANEFRGMIDRIAEIRKHIRDNFDKIDSMAMASLERECRTLIKKTSHKDINAN